jgi:hypothetical protein
VPSSTCAQQNDNLVQTKSSTCLQVHGWRELDHHVRRFGLRQMPMLPMPQDPCPLRARNCGLELVRVATFCPARIDSSSHVIVDLSGLDRAVDVGSARIEC